MELRIHIIISWLCSMIMLQFISISSNNFSSNHQFRISSNHFYQFILMLG